jgi:hypothetical protein
MPVSQDGLVNAVVLGIQVASNDTIDRIASFTRITGVATETTGLHGACVTVLPNIRLTTGFPRPMVV